METESVANFPASNISHPLGDTLQKAMEVLKNHQQWISNRANYATARAAVVPEQLGDVRVPKKDSWMMQGEDLVDKKITRFPVRKLKLGGFKPAAVSGKKIVPTSAIQQMQDVEEQNKPLNPPPKAVINAWDRPDLTSKETGLIAIDLEEDTSVVVKTNSSSFEDKTIKKEQESKIKDNSAIFDDIAAGDKDNDKIKFTTEAEPLVEDTIASEPTSSSELLHKDISFVSVKTPPPSSMPLTEVHVNNEDQHSVSEFDGHVLAVSPAPISQQLSLSAVTQSKLRMSELEAFRLENNAVIATEPHREGSADDMVGSSVQHNQKFSGNKKSVTVSDSVLHVVTPQQRNETHGQAAVFHLPKESSPIAPSVHASEKEKTIEEDATVSSIGDSSSRRDMGELNADSSITSVAKVLSLPELKGVNV